MAGRCASMRTSTASNAATQSITGSALWSQLNVAGSANEFDFDARTFDTGRVAVNSGATYLFLISTSNQGSGVPLDAANLVGANDANGYAGGALWVASNGSNFAALSTAGSIRHRRWHRRCGVHGHVRDAGAGERGADGHGVAGARRSDAPAYAALGGGPSPFKGTVALNGLNEDNTKGAELLNGSRALPP